MNRRLSRLVFACAAFAESGAVIGADVFEIDSPKSHANFEVKVMWLVNVHGDFGAVKGSLTVDRFRGSANVEADIDADDLHMRTHSHETWAKSVEFFDSAHFPKIHFSSASFPLARLAAGGEIEGTLTLRGVEQPIRLTVDAADCKDPLSGECAVEAWGAIHRSEFGMQSRRGALSDKVQLRLSAFVKPLPTEK
ncbi:MAG: YceI family protein [Rudaea sp.]